MHPAAAAVDDDDIDHRADGASYRHGALPLRRPVPAAPSAGHLVLFVRMVTLDGGVDKFDAFWLSRNF